MSKSNKIAQKVAQATERMLELIQDDDLNPTDALTKTAQEMRLQPDFVKLAAYAYNTGAQESQREGASSLLDKVADFPLADPEIAIGNIWSPKPGEKVAADYTQPPFFMRRKLASENTKRLHSFGIHKSAEAKQAAKDCEIASDKSKDVSRAYNQSTTLKRAVEEARYQSSTAKEQLLSAMGQLGDYFKQAEIDRLPLADVEWNAKHAFGDMIQPLFTFVRTRNHVKGDYGWNKAAKAVQAMRVDKTVAPWSLIENCIKQARVANAKQNSHVKLAEANQNLIDELLRPYGGDPATAKAASTSALMMGGALGSATTGLSNLFHGVGADFEQKRNKDIQDQLDKLEDPSHMNDLRKIQAEAMLQDLMANDEVISGHDPDNVLQKYNEISQLMPEASIRPAVVRSALRERLTVNPATFDASQLADIENKIREQTRPSTQTRVTQFPQAKPPAAPV